MAEIILKPVNFFEAAADIQAVRQAVFQVEQGVDASLDFDGQDAAAQHIVAYVEQQPVGTVRIRYLSDQLAKIERVAVLAAYRGQGIGKRLMEATVSLLDQQNVPESKVHAQSYVAPFYQKLGFQLQGEEFLEAEILHVEMRRIHPQFSKIDIDDTFFNLSTP